MQGQNWHKRGTGFRCFKQKLPMWEPLLTRKGLLLVVNMVRDGQLPACQRTQASW